MKLPQHSKSRAALTLFEVLLVIVILIILAGVLLPALWTPETRASRVYCRNNLKATGLAFRLWAGDNGDKYPMQVSTATGGTIELVASGMVFPHFQILSNELSTPKILLCPGDTQRKAAANFSAGFSNTNISYFLNVDATNDAPQLILAGDRNLTMNGRLVTPGLLTLRSNDVVGWGDNLHHHAGNLLMADGSVQQLTDTGARRVFSLPTNAPMRLAVP